MTLRLSSLFLYAMPLCLALWSCGGGNSSPQSQPSTASPTANNQVSVTHENTSLTDTLGNHANNVDYTTSTFVFDTLPSNGTIVVNDANTGNFTYTPDPSFSGSNDFLWYVTDQYGTSNIAK